MRKWIKSETHTSTIVKSKENVKIKRRFEMTASDWRVGELYTHRGASDGGLVTTEGTSGGFVNTNERYMWRWKS